MGMTNGDKVRGMTDRELSALITTIGCSKCENMIGKCLLKENNGGSCKKLVRKWLESECD